MPWARLDDDFHDNGKILSLSHQAFRLYVCAITYSRRHRSEGFLSASQVWALCGQQRVARAVVRELVEKCAWHGDEARAGYLIHDFADYQPKTDETAAERMRRHRGRNKTSGSEQDVTASDDGVTRNGDAPVPMPSPVPLPAATAPMHQPRRQTVEQDMLLRPAEAATVPDNPKPLESRYSPDFEAFWAIYPRKRDKAPAFKAHEAKLKHGATPELLRTAARHFAAYVEESGTDEEYLPYASTWLNEGKWLDFRDGVPHPAAKRGGNGRRPYVDPIEEAKAKIAARHAQQDTHPSRTALA